MTPSQRSLTSVSTVTLTSLCFSAVCSPSTAPYTYDKVEKNVSSVHTNGSSNGAALSLTQPSMLRESTLNRDSFTFSSTLTPSVSESPGQVEMPQLSRNHSLFGYLEVPSMSRNQSLNRAYDDPFGASPRGTQ